MFQRKCETKSEIITGTKIRRLFEKMCFVMVLIMVCLCVSSCKKNQEQEGKKDTNQSTQTISLTPTCNTLTPTIAPTNEPTSSPVLNHIPPEENLLSFQVQPITVPVDGKTPYMTKEEFPILDGSTANIPLGEAIYSHLTGASKEDAKKDLKFYKTPDSYRRLMSKEADILFVYEPSQTILREMLEQYAEFEFKPLGRDALVFIANETNSVDSLTQQEISDIYTGKITNWSKLGGDDQEILAFQRPSTSGSQTLMEKLAVPASQLMTGPQVVKPAEMGDLIDTLASYNNASNALGYSVYFYANYMYSKPGLKFMKINGIMPTNETIQKGEYPYVNDFYVVIRKEEPKDSKARILYDYMTTKEAQTILTKAGYVPVVDVNATYSTANKTIEMKGSLKLKPGQFLVDHNVTSEGVFEGDRLLTHDYHEVIVFPSKYIESGLSLDSDVVLLKSYQTITEGDNSYMHYMYELYSITKGKYLTDHPYTFVEQTLSGCYQFLTYHNGTGEVEEVIYSSSGKFICKAVAKEGKTEFIDVVKDKVVLIKGSTLIYYDFDGKEIKQMKLPYERVDSAYINSQYQYRNEDYLWLHINQNYYVIYDENGNRIDDQRFLKNLKEKPAKDQLWVINSIVGTDGHLYVVGDFKQKKYVLRDDGKVIFENDSSKKDIGIYLYPNVFTFYDIVDYFQHYMTLTGEILNEDREYIPQNNDAIILQKEGEFTVYPLRTSEDYVVKDKAYRKDAFWGYEVVTSPYLIQYFVATNHNADAIKFNFLGLRSFDNNATVTPTGDYFILSYEKKEKMFYEIIDKTGKPIFCAKEGEVIHGVYFGEEVYVSISTGNYEEIQGLDGNFLYRELSYMLSND